MRLLKLILLLPLFFSVTTFAQTQARIDNVDFTLDGNTIVVSYSLSGVERFEYLTIDLKFITESNDVITPKSATGDVGPGRFRNGIHTIRWDPLTDNAGITGNIKASVTILSSRFIYGGPSNSLFSLIVPGLGGQFTDKNKARAYATTISTIGLLGYSFWQNKMSDRYYDDYGVSEDPIEIEKLYNKANSAHHRAIISAGTAAGVWVFDIVWVTLRGLRNSKEAKEFRSQHPGSGFSLESDNQSFRIKYAITF
jgi:hypothetical protein